MFIYCCSCFFVHVQGGFKYSSIHKRPSTCKKMCKCVYLFDILLSIVFGKKLQKRKCSFEKQLKIRNSQTKQKAGRWSHVDLHQNIIGSTRKMVSEFGVQIKIQITFVVIFFFGIKNPTPSMILMTSFKVTVLLWPKRSELESW